MTTDTAARRLVDARWLAILASAAGVAGLSLDIPAAALLLVAPAAVFAVLYLLKHPGAWVAWFLAAGWLAPPIAFELGGVELPLHPAMLVLAAGCFVAFVRSPEWRIDASPLAAASGMLLASLLISLPWAYFYSGASVGAQSTLRWVLLAAGFIVLAWVAYGPAHGPDGASPALPRMILAAAFLAAVFAVIDFEYQLPRSARFSDQYIYLNSGPLRRAQGVFYDASALGNFCAMILTLILALGRRARAALRIPAWLLWLPVPALALALVLSFSRGSLVNLIIAVSVLAWLRGRALLSGRAILAFVAAGAAVAAAVLFIAPEFFAIYGLRWEFSALEFFARPNDVLSKRLDTWAELAGFIAGHPLQMLLGIGYKSLPYTSTFARAVVADNMYLSLLIESGVAGLLSLLVFCGAVLGTGWRLARHPDDAVAGLGRFAFAFWLGEMAQMLSGDILTYWRVTPVFLALLGIALRRARDMPRDTA